MAISTKTKEYIALEYAKYFGRTATESIIDYYGSIGKTSKILKQIIKDADIEQYKVHGDDLQAEVHNTFQNLFSRKADNKELQKYVKVLQKGKNLPINSIVKKATKFDKDVYNNKQEIAKFVAENGGGVFDLSKVTKANQIDVKSLTSLTDLQTKIDALPENSNVPSTFDGETYTLTIGADVIPGTAKDDIFVATEATLTSNDKLNGGQGQDTLDIVDRSGIKFNGFEANSIETIKVTADSTNLASPDTSVDLTYATDVTKLVNANSSQDLTFYAIDTVPVKGLELTKVTGGDTRLNFEATAVVGTADVLNVKLDNVKSTANAAVSSIIANGIETVNVTTTGTESKLFDIDADQTKVVIAGDKNLTIDNGATILAGTTTIDASAFKGNLTLGTVDSFTINKDVEVIGGSGNDKVSFNNGFEIGDKFDGGTGTDTIIMTDLSASVAAGATLANVEELEISDNGQRTIDMDNFASVSKVIYQAGISAASTATVKDAVSGLTVNVDSVVANGTLNVALKADASSDVVNVEIDEVTAANTIVALNANEAETLNLTVNDNATVVGKGALTVNNLSATDATKLNIKSDADLIISNVVNPATAILATIDANTSTGKLTIAGLNTAAAGATIKLGSGDDTYTVATSNGADTITLGAGKDTIIYNAVAQSDDQMDTITDFVQGADVLNLDALLMAAAPNSAAFVGNRATFALAQGALPGTNVVATGQKAVFQQDTSTLWIDSDANGTLDGNDFRIKLDGITALTAADLGFTVGNTVTLTAASAIVDIDSDTNADAMTTNEDDTINSTVAFLSGSNIDGELGTDVLNVTTDAAGINFNTYATLTAIEEINLSGAATAATMLNGAGLKITSTGNTTLTLGTGGQTYTGSASNDAITGTAGNDTVVLGDGTNSFTSTGGGNDTATGGTGVDTFNFTTTLTIDDVINGGAGADILNITDATAVTNLNRVTNVETVNITTTGATSLTTNNAFGAAGSTITINHAVAGAALTFNASAETDAQFIFDTVASARADILTGGALADTFNYTLNTGTVTLNGGAGNDTFNMGANLTSADTINGGVGTDTVNVTDDTATTDLDLITNVETINIVNTATVSSYTVADAVVAAGETLTINHTGTLGLTLDLSNETNGHYIVVGGTAALTSVKGGTLSDTITGGAGVDNFTITAGVTVANIDTLVDWNFDADKITTGNNATQVESVTVATADATNLIANMQTAVNTAIGSGAAWGTAAGDVMIVNVSAGDSAGTYLLVADAGNTAITAADFIVEITGFSGTIDTADFA